MKNYSKTICLLIVLFVGTVNVLADVEVMKIGKQNVTNDANVGVVPPVDITTDELNKFKVTYGNDVKNASVEILESGRVVYTDVDRQPGNTQVSYTLTNTTPGATYFVRVKTDGKIGAIEEIPVNND